MSRPSHTDINLEEENPSTQHIQSPIPLILIEPPNENKRPSTSERNASNAPLYSESMDTQIEIGEIQPIRIDIPQPNNRTVSRSLNGLQIFMITINATLGAGLYWRGGQILRLGGPSAVVLSFLIVGSLSWAIMQCITEMACMWPVPGAMPLYVAKFVDPDLGTIVGVAYWFTWAAGFPTLISTSAAEFDFYFNNNWFSGIVLFFLVPLVIVGINTLRVEVFGWLEVVSGFLKITFLFVIICALIAINLGAGPNDPIGAKYWNNPIQVDTRAANNWFTAFQMSLSIATFAFVGVEAAAASSLEAKRPGISLESQDLEFDETIMTEVSGRTIKYSAVHVTFWATLMYTLSGLLESFDIAAGPGQLSEVGWLKPLENDTGNISEAIIVMIAKLSHIPHLANIFNAFLIFTALTCASTSLFIGSRTLFGLTTRLDGGTDQPRYMRFFALFGKTNNRQVPRRAVLGTALFLCWVPFLQLSTNHEDTTSSINTFIDALGNMSSCSVLIVWACECLAFLRFHYCITKHRAEILEARIAYFPRSSKYYPYRSHFQPLLAYIALFGCLFLLLVANGAALWNGFHLEPFLSSYFVVLVFLGSWVLLKLIRRSSWSYVDLSDPRKVKTKLQDLHYLAREARS